MSQDEDLAARRELEATLDALSREQTNAVARAFSFFSILSNIAEDQHHIRRSRAHALAGSAPREGRPGLSATLWRAVPDGGSGWSDRYLDVRARHCRVRVHAH